MKKKTYHKPSMDEISILSESLLVSGSIPIKGNNSELDAPAVRIDEHNLIWEE